MINSTLINSEEKTMIISTDDHTAITYYDNGHFAACKCGWSVPQSFQTLQGAHDEAMDHVETARMLGDGWASVVKEVTGTITLMDGTRSEFRVLTTDDGYWQQWGATGDRLQLTAELVEAVHHAALDTRL